MCAVEQTMLWDSRHVHNMMHATRAGARWFGPPKPGLWGPQYIIYCV